MSQDVSMPSRYHILPQISWRIYDEWILENIYPTIQRGEFHGQLLLNVDLDTYSARHLASYLLQTVPNQCRDQFFFIWLVRSQALQRELLSHLSECIEEMSIQQKSYILIAVANQLKSARGQEASDLTQAIDLLVQSMTKKSDLSCACVAFQNAVKPLEWVSFVRAHLASHGVHLVTFSFFDISIYTTFDQKRTVSKPPNFYPEVLELHELYGLTREELRSFLTQRLNYNPGKMIERGLFKNTNKDNQFIKVVDGVRSGAGDQKNRV